MLDQNSDPNFRSGDVKTDVFGSDAMLQAAPTERIPVGSTSLEIAYPQTQPRHGRAGFSTTFALQ